MRSGIYIEEVIELYLNVTVQTAPFAKAPSVLPAADAANFAHLLALRSCIRSFAIFGYAWLNCYI